MKLCQPMSWNVGIDIRYNLNCDTPREESRGTKTSHSHWTLFLFSNLWGWHVHILCLLIFIHKSPPPFQRRPPMSYRPDRDSTHRPQFEKNRAIIFKTQSVCAICGNPVDMNLKWPHPLSKTVDHIIPISKGGHPSDIDNLQLAHFICNRLKSDKNNTNKKTQTKEEVIANRVLPLSIDWSAYRSGG